MGFVKSRGWGTLGRNGRNLQTQETHSALFRNRKRFSFPRSPTKAGGSPAEEIFRVGAALASPEDSCPAQVIWLLGDMGTLLAPLA